MNRPEEDLQRSVVEWLSWTESRWRDRMTYFAVPNQRGTRTRTEAEILKALGVRPGATDLVFLLLGGRVLCVELKAPGREGNLSEAQKKFRADCERLGVPHHVESTLEGVVALLERYGALRPARQGAGT